MEVCTYMGMVRGTGHTYLLEQLYREGLFETGEVFNYK